MFPFTNYSEFLEIGTDPGSGNNFKIGDPENYLQEELCKNSQIDIINKNFVKAGYPPTLISSNIFCPFCGKEVLQNQKHLTYQSDSYQRKFLTHEECLSNNSSEILNDAYDQVEEMFIKEEGLKQRMKPLNIVQREFCIELVIAHPLSDYKFIKLVSKGTIQENTIRWNIRQEQQMLCYLPNIICFPFVDFKISVILSEIGCGQNKIHHTYYVNLARSKSAAKTISVYSEYLRVQIKIYSSEEEKINIINSMNYKYKFIQSLPLPIIEITALQVQIPDQIQEDLESNPTIEELLSQKHSSVQSSIHSSHSLHSSLHSAINSAISSTPNYNIIYNQKPISDKCSIEKEKVDLEKLILHQQLSLFVRNNVQSRLFQQFLQKVSENQIELIISHLSQEFKELVMDQYANYMMQKLFLVSSPFQRKTILLQLSTHIPNIVRNKQGTHTIQAFTTLFIEKQQFQLANIIGDSIKSQFESLSTHQFSTHFIQSLMKIFPVKSLLQFFQRAQKNFQLFAIDKNAMCVLKHMMIRMQKQKQNPLIFEVKKNLINSITFNTDKIIQDCFGNYVIQFCFQLFGEQKSSGITDMIIQKFVQFSLQKYSSSVISKCISTYWKDKYFLNKLKEVLRPDGIIQMFRNRDGNKILLDLLQKYENTSLRDKIFNSLPLGENSKFCHDRWGVQFGVRSGPVGMEVKSFTQADAIHKKYRKK